jgi:multiple sugar transport system permease protein
MTVHACLRIDVRRLIPTATTYCHRNWTIYWRIMLPLSGPVIAIVAIYTFLFVWNDFMGPLIYLNSPENRTLALALNAFKGQYGVSDAHLLMAASCVTMLPCILLFFAMQRYFVESVAMTGARGGGSRFTAAIVVDLGGP